MGEGKGLDTSWRGCRVRLADAGWVQRHRTPGRTGRVRCRRGAASPVWKTSDFVVVSCAQQQVPVCRMVPATAAGEGAGAGHALCGCPSVMFFLYLPCLLASISETTLSTRPGWHASGRLFQKQELTILWGEGWPRSPSSTRGTCS